LDLKRLGVLLIVIGLILGPGYYTYCEYLSGQEIGRYELRERAERWTLPDGTIQRFVGHAAFQPIVLELTPLHNNVSLRLTFHAGADSASGTNHYQATLLDGDYPVVQRDLEVALKAGESRSFTVASFPVRMPNQHLFVLEELGVPKAAVQQVTVTAAQDVERLIPALAWTGLAALLGGAALVVFAIAVRR
jgi:hypothetical protein